MEFSWLSLLDRISTVCGSASSLYTWLYFVVFVLRYILHGMIGELFLYKLDLNQALGVRMMFVWFYQVACDCCLLLWWMG